MVMMELAKKERGRNELFVGKKENGEENGKRENVSPTGENGEETAEKRANEKKTNEKVSKKKIQKKLTPSVDLRLLDGRLPQQLRCRRGRLARHEPRDRVRLEHAALGRLQGRDLAERVELQKLGRLVRLAHLEARDLDGDPGELRGDERLVGVLVARVGVELELGGGNGG